MDEQKPEQKDENYYVKDEHQATYKGFVRHLWYWLSVSFGKYQRGRRYAAVMGNRDDGKDAIRTGTWNDVNKLHEWMDQFDFKYKIVLVATRGSMRFSVDDLYRDGTFPDNYYDNTFAGIVV